MFHVSNQPPQPHQTFFWFETSSYFDIHESCCPHSHHLPPSIILFLHPLVCCLCSFLSSPPPPLILCTSYFSSSSPSLPLSHTVLCTWLSLAVLLLGGWEFVCTQVPAVHPLHPGSQPGSASFLLKFCCPSLPLSPSWPPSKAFLGRPHLTREWMGRRNFSIGRLVQIHLE